MSPEWIANHSKQVLALKLIPKAAEPVQLFLADPEVEPVKPRAGFLTKLLDPFRKRR
jgi:hypothetical protein